MSPFINHTGKKQKQRYPAAPAIPTGKHIIVTTLPRTADCFISNGMFPAFFPQTARHATAYRKKV
ncbi:hypothetical protein BV914_07580 [Neisseria dumasiana]|nr:hypothetical protein BV914_07580 [Neisseria dumasiana]